MDISTERIASARWLGIGVGALLFFIGVVPVVLVLKGGDTAQAKISPVMSEALATVGQLGKPLEVIRLTGPKAGDLSIYFTAIRTENMVAPVCAALY